MNHTPTPWTYVAPEQRNWFGHEIYGPEKQKVCETNRGMGADQEARAKADAEHILKCVNMHDALMELVIDTVRMLADHPEAAIGNKKVHYLYLKAKGLLNQATK